jgi:lysozyme
MNRDSLRALLLKHEGLRLKPYKDTQGFLTIGVGRCIETTGITENEAMIMLEGDISKVVSYCRDAFPWFNALCDTRQNVICSMVFNLGAARFSEFKKMIKAVEEMDYATAANEMMLSMWAAQVCSRAAELAQMMRDGDTIH